MRFIVRIVVAEIVGIFVLTAYFGPSGFLEFIFALAVAVMAGAVPLLIFLCLILLPIELSLSRLGADWAIVIIAPVVGWAAPRLIFLIAPNHANAAAALPALIVAGVTGVIIWAVGAITSPRHYY